MCLEFFIPSVDLHHHILFLIISVVSAFRECLCRKAKWGNPANQGMSWKSDFVLWDRWIFIACFSRQKWALVCALAKEKYSNSLVTEIFLSKSHLFLFLFRNISNRGKYLKWSWDAFLLSHRSHFYLWDYSSLNMFLVIETFEKNGKIQ